MQAPGLTCDFITENCGKWDKLKKKWYSVNGAEVGNIKSGIGSHSEEQPVAFQFQPQVNSRRVCCEELTAAVCNSRHTQHTNCPLTLKSISRIICDGGQHEVKGVSRRLPYQSNNINNSLVLSFFLLMMRTPSYPSAILHSNLASTVTPRTYMNK